MACGACGACGACRACGHQRRQSVWNMYTTERVGRKYSTPYHHLPPTYRDFQQTAWNRRADDQGILNYMIEIVLHMAAVRSFDAETGCLTARIPGDWPFESSASIPNIIDGLPYVQPQRLVHTTSDEGWYMQHLTIEVVSSSSSSSSSSSALLLLTA